MKAFVNVSLELSVEVESEGDSWEDLENKIKADLYENPDKYIDMLKVKATDVELDDFEVYGTTIIEE